MTDKEKYDFIDHVVHLTLFAEDRLLNEHGGEYSRLNEDGIDSNEYYRIITERVISILKKTKNYMQEKSVSEELGEIILEGANFNKSWYAHPELAFKAGANWQKEQFEKNRLAHCDALTEEQTQMECDFVVQHVKKNNRTPTFIDAIEYGKRLQKQQMMAKAINTKASLIMSVPSICISLPLGVNVGDKVKVIVIKEE